MKAPDYVPYKPTRAAVLEYRDLLHLWATKADSVSRFTDILKNNYEVVKIAIFVSFILYPLYILCI